MMQYQRSVKKPNLDQQNIYSLQTLKELIQKQPDFIIELLAQLPSYVFWKNTKCVYLGCSDIFARSMGLASPQEIIGKTDFDLPTAREESAAYQADDKEVMRSRKPKLNIEETQTFSDGRKVILLTSKVPLVSKGNKVIGVLGIYTDITNRKRLEEDLRRAKEAAEAGNNAKTEFLENMRHDIRTPLSGIIGCANAIKENIRNPQKIEEMEEYADNLVASSNSLLSFLNEILETIKIASGSIPLFKKKFDLKNKLLDIIKLNQPKANQKKIELLLDYDKSIPHYLIGDVIRIHRIVLELVTNALNFTSMGHVKVFVSVAKKSKRDLIIKIVIEDTGIGIPLDKQQEIFTRFKRLTPSYEGIYKGAGLGLSVVKQYIDDIEGEIYVESELNKGTRFTCIIPLKKALLKEPLGVNHTNMDEIPFLKEAFSADVKSQLETNRITRILIVEDLALAAEVVRLMLSDLNCAVDIANDGRSAIAQARANFYDLILMDVGLPDISGYTVTQKIRDWENSLNRHTPILALTAHIETEDKQKCIEAGMDAVLSKPLAKGTAIDLLNAFVPTRSKQTAIKVDNFSSDTANLLKIDGKIIDLVSSAKLFNDNIKRAKDMLELLINSFPAEKMQLQKAFQAQDWVTIEKIAHKLRGGTYYCGTPRLQQACIILEDYLRTGATEIAAALYQQLLNEMDAVNDAYQKLN